MRIQLLTILLAALVLAPVAGYGEESAAPAESRMRLTLRSGHIVEGTILKEDSNRVLLDLGFEVLSIPADEVAGREDLGAEQNGGGVQTSEDALFSTADLPVKPIKELAGDFGEGVVMVKTPSGLGSGFIVTADGYVVSNHHVIAGEKNLTIVLYRKQGNSFEKINFEKVRIVAFNEFIDLALLKIEDKLDTPLTTVYFGDMDDVQMGDAVFAIGNPLGLERSITEGIVSNKKRNYDGKFYIQTDTPINPGNSGGPLFNSRGEVIGVTNMGYTMMDGLSFAIPISYVKDFLKNRDAFTYDKNSPNAGYRYYDPPRKGQDKQNVEE